MFGIFKARSELRLLKKLLDDFGYGHDQKPMPERVMRVVGDLEGKLNAAKLELGAMQRKYEPTRQRMRAGNGTVVQPMGVKVAPTVIERDPPPTSGAATGENSLPQK